MKAAASSVASHEGANTRRPMDTPGKDGLDSYTLRADGSPHPPGHHRPVDRDGREPRLSVVSSVPRGRFPQAGARAHRADHSFHRALRAAVPRVALRLDLAPWYPMSRQAAKTTL